MSENYEIYGNIFDEGMRHALSNPVPEKSIETLLGYVGNALKCGRMYIYEAKEKKTFESTYEWCAGTVAPKIKNSGSLIYEEIRDRIMAVTFDGTAAFRYNREVSIKNPEAEKYLLKDSSETLMAVPLIYDNEVIGFLGADDMPAAIMESVSKMFMMMGHFVVLLLQRRDLYGKVEYVKYYDLLTGVGNRHFMTEYLDNVDIKTSVGIVYCDVIGLKDINDIQGHKAGDELLIGATNCLKEVFGDYAIFRLGGDEFMVMCLEIRENTLFDKIEKLREKMQEKSVNMSVGYVWSPNGTDNLTLLFAEADSNMYEDKKKYYLEHNLKD